MDITPTIGFVPRPVPERRYVIYFAKRGDYAELNPATLTWSFTSTPRYATKFENAEVAEQAFKHVVEDCGDLWHLTREDLRVVERP